MALSGRELADTVSLFAKSSEAAKPPFCAVLQVMRRAWRWSEEEGVVVATAAVAVRREEEERAQEDAIAATTKLAQDRNAKRSCQRRDEADERYLDEFSALLL